MLEAFQKELRPASWPARSATRRSRALPAPRLSTAALAGGLIAIGIQPDVAVPVVITCRLATYWLPVAPGWAALHLLQRRDLI